MQPQSHIFNLSHCFFFAASHFSSFWYTISSIPLLLTGFSFPQTGVFFFFIPPTKLNFNPLLEGATLESWTYAGINFSASLLDRMLLGKFRFKKLQLQMGF